MNKNFFVSTILNISKNTDLEPVEKFSLDLNSSYENSEVILIIDQSESFKEFKAKIKNLDISNFRILNLPNIAEDQKTFAGIQNSIGDIVISFSDTQPECEIVNELVKKYEEGHDLVYVENISNTKESYFYKLLKVVVKKILKKSLAQEFITDKYSIFLISRRIIESLQNSESSFINFKQLIISDYFKKSKINYSVQDSLTKKITIRNSFFDNLSKVLLSTNTILRFGSIVSLSMSILSLLYSAYVLFVYLTKEFAEGWVTTSFQVSIFSFTTSLVLFILCEYIIILSNRQDSQYFIVDDYSENNLRTSNKTNINKINEV